MIAPEPNVRGAPWVRHLLALAGIALLGVSIYANALGGEFVLDDLGHIPENPHIRMTEVSVAALQEAAFESIDPLRPLAYVTLAFNYYWGGDDVFGYHAFNVALHVANAWLVYLLALVTFRLTARSPTASFAPGPGAIPWLALLAAGVFVAHPIQTQAVTYVIQRMTSLATFFELVALLAWLAGRMGPAGGRRVGLWIAAAAAWALALASKQIAIPLPIVLLLYEAFFFRDLDPVWLRRHAWLGAGALAAVIAVGVLAFFHTGLFDFSNRDFTMEERALTQLRVVMLYLGLVVWPSPARLNLAHHVETSHSLLDPPTTLLSGLALAVLLATCVLFSRRYRMACFGGLWLFLHLALESSVLPLEMVFEHRLYLPMVGVALGVAEAIGRIASERPRVALVVGVVIVTLLGVGTHERNRVWESALTLWADASAKSEGSFRAQYDYGVALYKAGRPEEAAGQFERAVRLDPEAPEALGNYGIALVDLGQLEEATEILERARKLQPRSAEAHVRVATVYAMRGDHAAALVNFRTALSLDPSSEAAADGVATARGALLRAGP